MILSLKSIVWIRESTGTFTEPFQQLIDMCGVFCFPLLIIYLFECWKWKANLYLLQAKSQDQISRLWIHFVESRYGCVPLDNIFCMVSYKRELFENI